MFRSIFKTKPSVIVDDLTEVKKAVFSGHLAAVDQFGMEDFGRNDAGWPRNTVSALARCETIEQYRLLSQRLTENAVVTDKNQSKDLDVRFAMIRPRYAQTPYEMTVVADQLAKFDIEYLKNRNTDILAKVAKAAKSVDSNQVTSTEEISVE